MRIDSDRNRSGGNCEYTKKSKNKQIFIDWVRNDRVTNDQVRNDRGLKMIGSHLYIMI